MWRSIRWQRWEGESATDVDRNVNYSTSCKSVADNTKAPLPMLGSHAQRADMITSTDIILDPDPTNSIVVKDQEWVSEYYELPDEDETLLV